MIRLAKAPAAAFGPRMASSLCPGALLSFHSTTVCERKRRTHWNSGFGSLSPKRFNNYAKRMRKLESKRTLLRNISQYAEHLFQSWKDDDDLYDSSPNEGSSWFRRQGPSRQRKEDDYDYFQWHSKRNKRKGGIEFCTSDDDNDVETIFRSAFKGERYYYWSFNVNENFHWRKSWDWRYRTDEVSETDDENDQLQQRELASERLALGLSPCGPLKIEEVKSAYRACALRWHPDRHQGSSKIACNFECYHGKWLESSILRARFREPNPHVGVGSHAPPPPVSVVAIITQ